MSGVSPGLQEPIKVHQDADQLWRFRHQPALQGVRGIAVLAAFAFHIGRLNGGWLGVEIFFVLSGFLITILLLDEARTIGKVSTGKFYLRRFARLLPAVTVMLATVIAFCWATDLASQSMAKGGMASLLYFANWAEVAGWAMQGFGHMWSLSIEEQFYVLWPLVLGVVFTRFGVRGVAFAAGIGFLASVVARICFAVEDDFIRRVYFGSDTRAAGLLIGCVAGALLHNSRGMLARSIPAPITWLAAGSIATGLFSLNVKHAATWLVWVTLLDIACALMLVALIDSTGFLARLLSRQPLVYIGEISYSLYLWHLPVIWAAGNLTVGPGKYVVQIVVPFLAAALSYHWIEGPLRRYIVQSVINETSRRS